MNKRTLRVLAALAVLASVALAACGGSSGPTKQQYTARANGICKTAGTQIKPLVSHITTLAASLLTGGTASAHKLAAAVSQLHEIAAADLAKLRKLRQPGGDHAAIEKFLTPLSTVVKAIGSAATTLTGSQPLAALALLQQVQPTAAQVTTAAQSYGLTRCEQILGSLG